MTVPLILFSGGLDSTYLLKEELDKGPVDILYIEGSQGDNKIKAELLARERIIKYLNKIAKYQIRNSYIYKINSNYLVPTNYKFGQAIFWILGAIVTYNENIHSSVKICYILGDDINIAINDIIISWNALCSFTKHTTIPLLFPLITTKKVDIVKNIDKKLYNLTFTCENPVKKPRSKYFKECGKCTTCINKKVTEYRIEYQTTINS